MELEIGKWYKIFNGLVCYQGDELKGNYGFHCKGWGEYMMTTEAAKIKGILPIPATNEEVEEALIAEAKKRGFKEKKTHNCHDHTSHHLCIGKIEMGWYDNIYALHFSEGAGIFYKDGNWASIINSKGEEVVRVKDNYTMY